MVSKAFIEKVFNIQKEHVWENYPMRECTTFKIGGPADLLVCPNGVEEFSALIRLCREENVPLLMVGAGSNLLVSDKGIDGVVVRLTHGFDFVTVDGTTITAGAGTSLAKLANTAQKASLSGLEFASGIPGCVGGAVYMNAGAYGGEMKDVITETTYLNENGDIKTVVGDAHGFGYRKSFFAENKTYIVSTKMTLAPKDPAEILATMRELNSRRKEKQPLEKASAGSTFKRPEGSFAGKLIEDAGLKGFSIGDASVSEKHAGFLVNNGSATCADVSALIEAVQKKVYDTFGVMLEPEVKIIGR